MYYHKGSQEGVLQRSSVKPKLLVFQTLWFQYRTSSMHYAASPKQKGKIVYTFSFRQSLMHGFLLNASQLGKQRALKGTGTLVPRRLLYAVSYGYMNILVCITTGARLFPYTRT